MDSHLLECKVQEQANRRNGKLKKMMKTGSGTFEPKIGKKRQTILNESLDNKVLSLYALGMSYAAI